MNRDETIRQLTRSYIQNALTEVKLLHDVDLITPTLASHHIRKSRIGFTARLKHPGRFITGRGFLPYAEYTVLDDNGEVLSRPFPERDLDAAFSDEVIEREIAANRGQMLRDHQHLVAVYRSGDPRELEFRYRAARPLAERVISLDQMEAEREEMRQALRAAREECSREERNLNRIRHQVSLTTQDLEQKKRAAAKAVPAVRPQRPRVQSPASFTAYASNDPDDEYEMEP